MVEVLRLYCMDCKEWIDDKDSHKCPINHWVVADKDMVGIADRLYSMGIVPMTAMWFATELSNWDDFEYQLTLKIDIGARISESVLGELPTGWHYYWETAPPIKVELHLIAYVEHWYNFGFETAKEHIDAEIKRFEEFLDTRDAAATKALLLLTSC